MTRAGRCEGRFAWGAALLLALGCASNAPEVSSVYDPLWSFPQTATYVWDDAQNRLPEQEQLREIDLDTPIRETTQEELAARGYRLARGERPNFRLSYQASAHTITSAESSRAIGSVSLLMVDAGSGHLVWTGFGRAEVLVGLTPVERRARIRESVAAMLEGFPPHQRGEQ